MTARGLRWPDTRNGAAKGRGGRSKRLIAPQTPERVILKSCLAYLNAHPAVAFVFRANTGLVQTPDGRRFKAGFKGCADVLGMTKNGSFIAIEVKRAGKDATPDQAEFLRKVNAYGGYGMVVRSIDDCRAMLESLPPV